MTTVPITGHPVISGHRLILRPLTPEDVVPGYLAWMNDPGVTRFLESRFRSWSREDLEAYIQAERARDDSVLLAITLRDDGRHIGNIKLGPIDSNARRGAIGLLIGEGDCRGRGYGTQAIRLIVRHAFEDLGLHRVHAGCYATNVGSIAAFKKAGFREEGRQRQHWRDGETYVDGVLLGLLREEWCPERP